MTSPHERVAEVVLVNGPSGVGKTTVAGFLADLQRGTVWIRGDDVRGFAPHPNARAYLGRGSTYRAIAALTKAYLGMGAARVVVDYVFLGRSSVACFRDALAEPEVAVYLFTLWAPLEVVQARERGRVGRSPLGAAVEECWHEIASARAILGELVDNTDADPAQLAHAIAASIARPGPGLALLAGE
jgi:predicted kinase